MASAFYGLARAGLFALPPEDAHEVSLRLLERGLYPRDTLSDPPQIGSRLWGLQFKNPLGIAAGYDKDARVPDAVLGLGCGFAEVGTLTPLAQPGNPRPRVFRLVRDHALINRLGDAKATFLKQPAHGMHVWQQPFEELRAPTLVNLRMDPFELAQDIGMDYQRWYLEHMFMIAPAGAYLGQWLQSFKEFPPRQEPGSFNLSKVMEAVTAGAKGTGN